MNGADLKGKINEIYDDGTIPDDEKKERVQLLLKEAFFPNLNDQGKPQENPNPPAPGGDNKGDDNKGDNGGDNNRPRAKSAALPNRPNFDLGGGGAGGGGGAVPQPPAPRVTAEHLDMIAKEILKDKAEIKKLNQQVKDNKEKLRGTPRGS